MKGFVIAGTHSGVGKTSLSIGLMAAFRRRGLKVQPFKVGPDFIDPTHHEKACTVPSYNLDGWMLSKKSNREIFSEQTASSDLAIVEGVMGLYDGYQGNSEAGSTAQMAKWLGLPVILVVDAGAMARSVAALVKGFAEFDPELKVAGIIFNKIGSPKHLKMLTDSLENYPITILGGVSRDASLLIPERHLGLWMAKDEKLAADYLAKLADVVEKSIDLEKILQISQLGETVIPAKAGIHGSPTRLPARQAKTFGDDRLRQMALHSIPNDKPTVRIGIARDKAFCFYYQDNFNMMKERGAELVFFSPLIDRLPLNLDAIYLGGGYPELYAKELSENSLFISDLQAFAKKGGLVYGECGGMMYLSQGLKNEKGDLIPWVGIFPFWIQMASKSKLGYVEVEIKKTNPFFSSHGRIRAHRFHYSEIIGPVDSDCCYEVKSGHGEVWQEGFLKDQVLGSYVHFPFRSNPQFLDYFLSSCRTKVTAHRE